jgi:hypothetical protein
MAAIVLMCVKCTKLAPADRPQGAGATDTVAYRNDMPLCATHIALHDAAVTQGGAFGSGR